MALRNIIRAGNRKERALDTLLRTYTEQGKFSGAALAARGGQIVLSKGYGLANREHDILNTPHTPFRIGSMTKPFTAIAIMQLVEAGRVGLDDTLSLYLPDFPNGDRITVHHLLSNTSGIPDYIVMPRYAPLMKMRLTLPDLFALFRDEPLMFEPGTAFSYSNSNWVLLGYIIEAVTGKPYAEVIQERIFAPAGMTNSGYAWETPLLKGRAVGYVDTGSEIENALVVDESTMHGAGALYSTVVDLYRWDTALRSGKLLHPETLKRMTTPVMPGYAYGWERYTLHGRDVVAHSGGIPGFVANIARFDDAVVILLSNLGSAAYNEITRDLSAALFDVPYELPSARTFVSVDPSVFSAYVGEFKTSFFGRTSILKFSIHGDKLVMDISGLPRAVLSPMSETTYYARSKGDVEMTFVREPSGEVNTITMVWSGYDLKAERIA